MEIENIEDFKEKYDNHIQNIVFPEVMKFEKERKIRLTLVNLTILICSLILISSPVLLNSTSHEWVQYIIATSFVALISVKQLTKKNFEEKVKTMVMPIIMKSIPGFRWQEPPITRKDMIKCKILPPEKMKDYSFEDGFIGKYKNINIAISEYYTNKNSTNNFSQGVIVKFDMNKNFNGNTVIRPRDAFNVSSEVDLKLNNMEKIDLEDPNFNEKFFVYSTDPIEARYLLTPAFMERLYETSDAFNSKAEYCSFYENSIYIVLDTGEDMFDLCDLNTPMDDKEQYNILYNELASILDLIDYFKLDQKLGL